MQLVKSRFLLYRGNRKILGGGNLLHFRCLACWVVEFNSKSPFNTSLRKHLFLLALRRETSPTAKSEEKQMFSQASLIQVGSNRNDHDFRYFLGVLFRRKYWIQYFTQIQNVSKLYIYPAWHLYSQLSLRRTALGPAPSVRLREVSVL